MGQDVVSTVNNPLRNRTAATFVVNPTGADADFTTIAAALAAAAALPAGVGADIYLREGTYSISVTLTLSDREITIRGAGRGATILDLGSNAIAIFTLPFDQPYSFKDFSMLGDGSVGPGQICFNHTSGVAVSNEVLIERVQTGISFPAPASQVHRVFVGTATNDANGTFVDCLFQLPVSGTAAWWTGSNGRLVAFRVRARGTAAIFSQPEVQMVEVVFADTISIVISAANTKLIACEFADGSITIGNRAKISHCNFAGTASGTHIISAGIDVSITGCCFEGAVATHVRFTGRRTKVIGCSFQGFTSEAILVNDALNGHTVAGCSNAVITELLGIGIEDPNVYSGNTGLGVSASTFVGTSEVIATAATVVVDLAGNGDVDTLATAITRITAIGAGKIFLREGTYLPVADVVLPAGVSLVGAGPGPSIIDFAGGAFGITYDGSARQTTGGTITATNGSTAIVGIGTTFTTLLAGDFILIGGVFHEISVITDDLNLTLVEAYQGETAAGLPEKGQSMFKGGSLENLVIQNSTVNGLLIRQGLRFTVRECTVKNCGDLGGTLDAVLIDDSSEVAFLDGVIESSNFDSLRFLDSSICRVEGTTIINGDGRGIRISGCISVVIDENICNENGGEGILVDVASVRTVISECICNRNTAQGVESADGTDITLISGCDCSFNGSAGIDVDGTKNTISECNIEGNGADGIFTGDFATITGNHIHDNAGHGIDLDFDTFCTVTGNHIEGNTLAGIFCDVEGCVIQNNVCQDNGEDGIRLDDGSLDCVVDGNRCDGNTESGIEVVAGGTDNIVTSNNVKDNTGTNLVDAGTNTILANNQT